MLSFSNEVVEAADTVITIKYVTSSSFKPAMHMHMHGYDDSLRSLPYLLLRYSTTDF